LDGYKKEQCLPNGDSQGGEGKDNIIRKMLQYVIFAMTTAVSAPL
jgi:hypothetical protein